MHDDIETKQLVGLVAEAMERIADKQREILILANVQQLNAKEIAEILGIGITTVRWRLYDARAALRKEINALIRIKETPAIDVTEIISQAKELSPFLISHLKKHPGDLRGIEPAVFEHLIAEFFASWGYTNVAVVGQDSWTGADVVAMSRNDRSGIAIKHFVEVKRWRRKIGVEVVDRMVGAMSAERHKYGWHVGMIVGLAGFKELKRDNPTSLGLLGVELRNGDRVNEWLARYQPSGKGLWLPTPLNPNARAIYSGNGRS